uniref:Variant surface glycoprotein 1745 n=1 Tax=Trypanosoma brucei TaxID=5691 RepID=M4T0W2_9TRYP|nr:variant surface glycoprotein 1745 [Trypanosoma brucei]
MLLKALVANLFITVLTRGDDGPTGDATLNKVTTPCLEAAYAEAAASEYNKIADNVADAHNQIARQAFIWWTSAAVEKDNEQAALLLGAATYASKLVAQQVEKGRKTAQKLRAAALQLKLRQGYLEELIKQAQTKYARNPSPWTRGGGAELANTLGNPTAAEPTFKARERKLSNDALIPTKIGEKGLLKLKYTAENDIAKLIKKAKLQVSAGNSCAAVNSPAAQVGGCTAPIAKGAQLTLTTNTSITLATEDILEDNAQDKTCKHKSTDENIQNKPKELLLHTVCEAQIAAQHPANKLTDITLENLSQD